MKYALWIRGGTILDPTRGVEGTGDVFVRDDRIVERGADKAFEVDLVIDAHGCLVLPGLIDFHAHLFARGTEIGVEPDSGLLPQGVTTAVDAGSAGISNYRLLASAVIARSAVRMKAFLNVSPAGLPTTRYPEDVDPRHYDLAQMRELFAQYRDELLGLKIRQSRAIVRDLGLEPLRATLEIADRLECPVVVHTTDPPVSAEEMAELLRPGDVFCHVFHGTGQTILGPDGTILPAILSARKRGVLFDAANGRSHFAFSTARTALKQGFLPDVISSDLTSKTLYRDPVFGLPYVMSKYLALGVPLLDVVAACTSTPARLLGMAKDIGTLAVGAYADIAIFKCIARNTAFRDTPGDTFTGSSLLIPKATVRQGQVVFRQPDL